MKAFKHMPDRIYVQTIQCHLREVLFEISYELGFKYTYNRRINPENP